MIFYKRLKLPSIKNLVMWLKINWGNVVGPSHCTIIGLHFQQPDSKLWNDPEKGFYTLDGPFCCIGIWFGYKFGQDSKNFPLNISRVLNPSSPFFFFPCWFMIMFCSIISLTLYSLMDWFLGKSSFGVTNHDTCNIESMALLLPVIFEHMSTSRYEHPTSEGLSLQLFNPYPIEQELEDSASICDCRAFLSVHLPLN